MEWRGVAARRTIQGDECFAYPVLNEILQISLQDKSEHTFIKICKVRICINGTAPYNYKYSKYFLHWAKRHIISG